MGIVTLSLLWLHRIGSLVNGDIEDNGFSDWGLPELRAADGLSNVIVLFLWTQ